MSTESLRTRKFNSSTYAHSTLKGVNLTGKTYAITGTTSGIGIETARSLVLAGAHIVMLNRNLEASEQLKRRLLGEMRDAEIDVIECDLSSLRSVKRATEVYLESRWPIDGLILNAGVFGPAAKITSDGLEAHFGINHLAHFLIIREFLPLIRKCAPSRIVLVSSTVHAQCGVTPEMPLIQKMRVLCSKSPDDGTWFRLYARSKMCNMLTAFKLHRDEVLNEVSTYSVHPGSGVRTNIFRDSWLVRIASVLSTPFTKNIGQGAATSVYCAAHPEVATVSGRYWDSCWDDEKGLYEVVARDVQLQDELWEHSNELVNLILEREHEKKELEDRKS